MFCPHPHLCPNMFTFLLIHYSSLPSEHFAGRIPTTPASSTLKYPCMEMVLKMQSRGSIHSVHAHCSSILNTNYSIDKFPLAEECILIGFSEIHHFQHVLLNYSENKVYFSEQVFPGQGYKKDQQDLTDLLKLNTFL